MRRERALFLSFESERPGPERWGAMDVRSAPPPRAPHIRHGRAFRARRRRASSGVGKGQSLMKPRDAEPPGRRPQLQLGPGKDFRKFDRKFACAARENLSKSACPQAEVHQIDPTSSFKELSRAPKAQFTCQIAARQPGFASRMPSFLLNVGRCTLASNDDLTNRYAAHCST